jgi:hypothetical protein
MNPFFCTTFLFLSSSYSITLKGNAIYGEGAKKRDEMGKEETVGEQIKAVPPDSLREES